MTRLLLLAAAVAVAVLGCTGPQLKDNTFDDGTVRYDVGAPGKGWQPLRLQTANAAWHNDALDASLLVNSHCEGVKDSPLAGLTSDLLMGMTDRQMLAQKVIPWSRREAMESTAKAKLDGVARQFRLFVLKKDGCVYDIVLDADPSTFASAEPAYTRVRDGFDVAPRRDRM